jgi:hypothetical protein
VLPDPAQDPPDSGLQRADAGFPPHKNRLPSISQGAIERTSNRFFGSLRTIQPRGAFMNIAITTSDATLDSTVFYEFAQTPYLLIVNLDTKAFTTIAHLIGTCFLSRKISIIQ